MIANPIDLRNTSDPDTIIVTKQKVRRFYIQLLGYWRIRKVAMSKPIQVRKMGDFLSQIYLSWVHIRWVYNSLLYQMNLNKKKYFKANKQEDNSPSGLELDGINSNNQFDQHQEHSPVDSPDLQTQQEQFQQQMPAQQPKLGCSCSQHLLNALFLISILFLIVVALNYIGLQTPLSTLVLQKQKTDSKIIQTPKQTKPQIKQANNQLANTNPSQSQSQHKNQKVQLKKAEHQLFKHSQLFSQKNRQHLNQLLKDTFYDQHYFIEKDEKCELEQPNIMHLAENKQGSLHQERPLLSIAKTDQQLQNIIDKMIHNSDRPAKFPNIRAVTRVSPKSIDLAYFFHALNYDPNNQDYLQAEYYRYQKLYNIGKYKSQLPLCISLVGKNTLGYQDKLYSTIQRQNYTNYRIVHIDDNSNDGTQEKIMQMIKQKAQFGKKITFITQRIRRNQLYNRDMAIRDYCQEDSIVLDMDADDWIIGNQVFQLVNSLYQSGQIYKGSHNDLWAVYFGHIIYQPHCPCILPNIDGQIPEKQFTQHTYRSSGKWRTTHLRTFLRKIYLKIDTNDFVDKQSMKDYYYPQSPDAFIHSAILELSGPKHLKVLDQFLYFYTTSLSNMRRRDNSLDIHYSGYTAKALVPYKNLQSLNDPVKRIENYEPPQNVFQDMNVKTEQIRKRRDKIIYQIEEMISRQQNNY